MDIDTRLKLLEMRVAALEGRVHAEGPAPVPTNKTQYLPQITEELVAVSKLDSRSEETRVQRPRKTTTPELQAAVNACTKAIEVQKLAEELVEEVQHLAGSLMRK